MALQAPVLDDRRFQDIVDELKKRIPLYCPEWTDHNVSDPGVTMIELFAWVADLLIYRINRIPDLHYVKFMELLGIRLEPPTAAQTQVTFYLSEPQLTTVMIPWGTEVSTTQTETERPIIFTTDQGPDQGFKIHPPQLDTVMTINRGSEQASRKIWDITELLTGNNDVNLALFSDKPQENDAFYLGFRNDLSMHVLRLGFNLHLKEGSGIRVELPPLEWEVSTDTSGVWTKLDPEDVFDTTKGFNESGRVELHLPQIGMCEEAGISRYWLRVRVIEPTQVQKQMGMSPYERTPKLKNLAEVVSIGGTLPATNVVRQRCEVLGKSDGSAGQRFYLNEKPVLKTKPDECLWMVIDDQPELNEKWVQREHFAESKADDPHYLLDDTTGEIRLGPAIPQPDGTIRCYGRTPARGTTLIFEQYRTGGGVSGNLGKGKINRLKTSIPFVDRVMNRRPASGGKDGQSLEAAKLNVTGLMQTRQRAVTARDYEELVLTEFNSTIARAYCHKVVTSVNQVEVIVIPHATRNENDKWLTRESLYLSDTLKKQIQDFLDDRKMLTVQLSVNQAFYQWVSVVVQLGTSSLVSQVVMRNALIERLEQFIDPIRGGNEGKGWVLGEILTKNEIRNCIEGLAIFRQAKVAIKDIILRTINLDQLNIPETVEQVILKENGVVVSYDHQIEFI